MNMPREWNWKETGGQIGWVRRLPGYTIKPGRNGLFWVYSDKTGDWVSANHASPDEAEKANEFRKPAPLT